MKLYYYSLYTQVEKDWCDVENAQCPHFFTRLKDLVAYVKKFDFCHEIGGVKCQIESVESSSILALDADTPLNEAVSLVPTTLVKEVTLVRKNTTSPHGYPFGHPYTNSSF
jgi:hypothetical protein